MKKILFLLGLVILVVGIINFPRNKILLPDEIVGTWASDDERYVDRFFRLSKTSVIFGTGDTDIDVYFINDTSFVSLGTDEVVELSIHKAGQENTRLSLIYENDEIESLRFLHQQKVIWYRISEDELVLF